MARPALSASRTTAVLDLLTAFPGRAFTMAEIVRATKINVASCHAVLAALTSRGYLTRLPQKTYVLGPALIAVGHASRLSQPLVARAQDKAVVVTVDRDLTAAPVAPCFDRIAVIGERTLEIGYRKDRVNAGDVLDALQKEGFGIVDVSTRDPDLEDVFLSLTRESA